MTIKPAGGVRGTLIDARNDGRFVFRVYGEPDPATGRSPHTDYALRVADLPVEIASDYYELSEPGPGESGEPCLGYARRSPEQKAAAMARASRRREDTP